MFSFFVYIDDIPYLNLKKEQNLLVLFSFFSYFCTKSLANL